VHVVVVGFYFFVPTGPPCAASGPFDRVPYNVRGSGQASVGRSRRSHSLVFARSLAGALGGAPQATGASVSCVC